MEKTAIAANYFEMYFKSLAIFINVATKCLKHPHVVIKLTDMSFDTFIQPFINGCYQKFLDVFYKIGIQITSRINKHSWAFFPICQKVSNTYTRGISWKNYNWDLHIYILSSEKIDEHNDVYFSSQIFFNSQMLKKKRKICEGMYVELYV